MDSNKELDELANLKCVGKIEELLSTLEDERAKFVALRIGSGGLQSGVFTLMTEEVTPLPHFSDHPTRSQPHQPSHVCNQSSAKCVRVPLPLTGTHL